MSTVDRALALLTGDDAPPAPTPSARTIEKAVAWEIEDEIAAKTGRARFGPLQALAGDLDALEESIKEVDAWLAKNVDDLDGVDAAVRDVSDDTKTNEVVTENLEALDRVLAKVVATAPQGLSLHPRAEKALRLRSVDRDVTRGADQLRAALKNASVLRKDDTYQGLRSVREQKNHLDRVRSRFAQDASKLASKRLSNVFMRQDSVGGTTASAEQRRDALLRRQAAAHDRVLKDASLKTLCGALARIRASSALKACHQAWAKASASMYGESIAALIDALKLESRFVERLLDDVIPVVDREQSFAKKVFGARDDDCLKVQFAALRQALLNAAAASDTDPITVYAACDRKTSSFVSTLLKEARAKAADGIRQEVRLAGDRCDAQDLKRYKRRDHKLGGAPADGAAFACSLCDAVERSLSSLDDQRVRKDVVEPAYKALLLKVDVMIERTAAANAKHAHLSVVETRYFLARRLLNHTKSPRLQAYAAKCRAASDDASKAYATAMMDNAFPKASLYFDARSRGAATSAKGFDAARSEVAKAEKGLRSLAERLDKHVAARGDDALRGMLRGCVFGHAAAAIASYDALARADGRGLEDAARAVALAKRMRAL
ncbi:unnamed protein product [Pelagomonas calceolata]|uniref:Exocyst complex component n=1 Tax=Pelagomonas calceolata TaxID=35677 RepID=A0A7S4A8C2_9STRA|nr:unnamed protein product [Pelagomonas calceolata]